VNYRKEVDGLRALAVIPVILFHAGLQPFRGGFIGVDVFFVISGYLITTIILNDKESGNFTFIGFYERRLRRILPALFFIMLLCIPFARLWMMPNQLKDFAQSSAAVSLFASNLLFYAESGYFQAASEVKPLLHTWSLAVEEQYYLLYPFFLILIWKLGRRSIVSIVSIIALISLALAQFGVNLQLTTESIRLLSRPDWVSSFFLPFGRAWELMLGGLVAFRLNSDSKPVKPNQLAALIGLALIVYAILYFDQSLPYPSVYTLTPTLGAALILLFATPKTYVGNFLSLPIFVGIGLISYSAYLWHHPLFAFARLMSINKPSTELFMTLTFFTFIFAYLSWKYIELPFRDKNRITRRQVYSFALFGSCFFIAVLPLTTSGFIKNSKFENLITTHKNLLLPENGNIASAANCKWKTPMSLFPEIKECEFGELSSEKNVFLWGDSHADASYTSLGKELKKAGIRGRLVKNFHCDPILGFYRKEGQFDRRNKAFAEQCIKAEAALMDYVRNSSSLAIIASVRWTFKLYPTKNHIEELDFFNGENMLPPRIVYREFFSLNKQGEFVQDAKTRRESIHTLMSSFKNSKTPLILIYPVPEVGWDLQRYYLNYFNLHGKMPDKVTTDHSNFKVRHKFIQDEFDKLDESDALIKVRPESLLCNTFEPNKCLVMSNNTSLYTDSNHLSNAGAALVAEEIIKSIQLLNN
jgi:peptidoglycan/LPS O-acetylase OafA/YrhL